MNSLEAIKAEVEKVREEHGKFMYLKGCCFCGHLLPCPTLQWAERTLKLVEGFYRDLGHGPQCRVCWQHPTDKRIHVEGCWVGWLLAEIAESLK